MLVSLNSVMVCGNHCAGGKCISTASVQKVNMYRAHAAQFSTQSAQLPLDSRREQICTTSNVFRPVMRKNYRDTLDIT
jgi:hypothetical protein